MYYSNSSLARVRVGITLVALFGLRVGGIANELTDQEIISQDIAPRSRPGTNDRLDLSGHVHAVDGRPIANATVLVWTAGVRVGTSSFCPSCYADCGKRAETDPSGAFILRSLDGDLVFQLVVVAEGFQPQLVANVDPAEKQTLRIALQTRTRLPDDPMRRVYGQLVSQNGDPIAGALVSPFGCKTDKQSWWGPLPGVDPLAVTNSEGKFMITTQDAVHGLDLDVTARGYLKKKIVLAASGKDHRFEISTGARVRGRVLQNGKPVPNILVGLAQKSRSGATFLGPYQIGTDKDGRFDFYNLPTEESVFVYGIIDSVRDHGAIPAKEVRTGGNEALTDVGNLHIVPGHIVSGRIVLSDGKPVPPRGKTGVRFGFFVFVGVWARGTGSRDDLSWTMQSGFKP